MSEFALKTDAEGLPVPTPVGVLCRVALQAYVATAHLKPAKRAPAFLQEMQSIFENEEKLTPMLPGRTPQDRAPVMRARREASALFEAIKPSLIAKLPADNI